MDSGLQVRFARGLLEMPVGHLRRELETHSRAQAKSRSWRCKCGCQLRMGEISWEREKGGKGPGMERWGGLRG